MSPDFFKSHISIVRIYCESTCGLKPITTEEDKSNWSTLLKLYWHAVKNFSDDQWKKACEQVIVTFKPTYGIHFPTIAHFYESIGYTIKDMSIVVMANIKVCIKRIGAYESISFADEAVHAAIASCGGWPAITRWTDKEWDVNEGRLLESIRSMQKSGVRGDNHLSGIYERENGYFNVFFVHLLSEPAKKEPYKIRFFREPDNNQIDELNRMLSTGIKDTEILNSNFTEQLKIA